jgi:Peptidase family S41
VATLATVLTYSASAYAGTFNTAGEFSFDPKAIVRLDFEATPQLAGLKQGTGPALEGDGYVVVQTERAPASLRIDGLAAANKSYVARFFARKNRFLASVNVDYQQPGSPGFQAWFYPTGRVTSDGWYEVETAPFSIEGTRKFTARLDMIASGADLDAVEFSEVGAFKSLAQCSGSRDAACGAGEYCAAGYCRNGNIQVPRLPDVASRPQVTEYLAERLQLFFGGVNTRKNTLPIALATIAKMTSANTGYEYWNGYATAVHKLRDWHTTINGQVGVAGRGALPVCFVEGNADLSRTLAPSDPKLPDVLVAFTGPEGNSGLKPGDRLVAVNGVHPIAFAEALDDVNWDYWHSNDPEGHAEAVEKLRFAIRRWGKTLTFVRCDAASGSCRAPQTISVSELPQTEPEVYPNCDHRPRYHVAGPAEDTHYAFDVYHGLAKESQPGEDIYGMLWNSVLLESTNPADNVYSPAIEEFRANAKAVILDHRQGDGGTELAAEYLTTLFRGEQLLGASTSFNFTLGQFDNFSTARGLTLFDARKGGSEGFNVGSATARSTMKTALLLARDGSASDWFPEGMRGGGQVRIFGRRTAGAFSSYIQFDYYAGMNWRVASGDYIRANGMPHIGEGVLPDEDLLPLQSDLVVGRDTVYERALQWVRER